MENEKRDSVYQTPVTLPITAHSEVMALFCKTGFSDMCLSATLDIDSDR